jgi:hypothetical protein
MSEARLRKLPWGARVGLTGVVASLLIGLAASLAQLVEHHQNRDERPGVSLDDLRGAYHGVSVAAPLLRSLESGHPAELESAERELLLAWLRGGELSARFDDPDAGARAPAEILSRSCLGCHGRKAEAGGGIGQRIPLEYWDDVDRLAHARDIAVVPLPILIASTHTHATTLSVLTLAALALLFATRFGVRFKSTVALAMGVALAVDLASWWLARGSASFVYAIVGAGAVWFASMLTVCIAVLLELWLPAREVD